MWPLIFFSSAYEMLSDPVKRRAFNSVDPTFDNSVPSKSEAKDNFFEVFSPVFERNSRWVLASPCDHNALLAGFLIVPSFGFFPLVIVWFSSSSSFTILSSSGELTMIVYFIL